MISNVSQLTQAATPVASTSSAAGADSPAHGAAVNANAGSASSIPVTGVQSDGNGQNLANAVVTLNSKVQNLNRNLQFSIDQTSGDLVVKVIDTQTQEVIRQIPSKEAMAMAQNIDQYLQDHHVGLVKAKA